MIHESFKLDRSYVYSIGLKIVLDVDVINQASIEAAIDRFVAVGETDWVSPEPLPRDRLPVASEHETLATITFPAEWISLSDMSHLNMNFGAVRPPIAFAAKNVRFVSNFPQWSDEL